MLGEYLARIGLEGRPSIAEVHRAHATSIPFENLDPHQGIPVSLGREELFEKLVTRRRGGYCFEQNLLLAAALEELGASVGLMLARVRAGGTPGVTRPRTHLVLHVVDGEEIWHADVGFGLGTLLEPIPFGPGGEYVQSGWRFRVVEDRDEYVLQQADPGGRWVDQYGFVPEPVPPVDVELGNWWTCTRPDSPFVTGLIVARYNDDGSLTAVRDWGGLELAEATPEGSTSTPIALEEVPALLAEHFGLPGFEVGADGRLVASG